MSLSMSMNAGELREELTQIYAHEHVPPWIASRANWIIGEIHRLTDVPPAEIIADVNADLDVMS
jgi:hypothetical protein